MRKLIAAAALIAGMTFGTAAQAQIVGNYTVRGGCPGQQDYTGRLSIERSGVLYKLTWVIGRDTYFGTAIEQDGALSIAFASADWKGIMAARPSGPAWRGVWSIYNSGVRCTETWTR